MRKALTILTLLVLHHIPPLVLNAAAQPVKIRVATFNLEDVRTSDLHDGTNARLRDLARVIADIRPNIILLNEIAYDMPGGPDVDAATSAGSNAARFAEMHLAGLEGVPRYRAWMPPVNTGVPTGFDLDNDGRVSSTPAPAGDSAAARAYGNDCHGYGTFPGQYGMALLVDERLVIDEAGIRTFQRFPWSYMQGAFLPFDPSGKPWFTGDEPTYVRLSSKTFASVPVKLPNGATVHLLCSHPTPPAFDGPEQRNRKRNHDEIRLIGEYIDDAPFLVDDAERVGGLGRFDSFIVLGDLNADPRKGDSFKNPIERHLKGNRRVRFDFTPVSTVSLPGFDPADTASFKLRVDYVLPSKDIEIVGGEVWRHVPEGAAKFPSDHFPVYLDVKVPPPAAASTPGPKPAPTPETP